MLLWSSSPTRRDSQLRVSLSLLAQLAGLAFDKSIAGFVETHSPGSWSTASRYLVLPSPPFPFLFLFSFATSRAPVLVIVLALS